MTISSNLAYQAGAPVAPAPYGAGDNATADSGSSLYEQAQEHFVLREYTAAAVKLEKLLGLRGGGAHTDYLHGTTAALLLLARAYYHSAQLARAETTARQVLGEDPADGYAALLLGRSLQRQGRHAEAGPVLRLAKALGAPDLDD
ncbi:MAG: hypothetical protein Q4G51_07780 [Dermatophilus congolensis]|nr:hypothetical protein [Dermatophilus congolensis]